MRDIQTLHIVGISGSLRRASLNSGLLRAAQSLLPAGATMEIAQLDDIPLYDGDLDGPVQPSAVGALKAAIARADGVLIACPEYNYSFTGVLKNAIDWVSRPQIDSPLVAMPVALIGVGGRFGTVRAQLHLRQVLVAMQSYVMPKPEFLLGMARDKFDADGDLTDQGVRRELEAFLKEFAVWTERLRVGERQTG